MKTIIVMQMAALKKGALDYRSMFFPVCLHPAACGNRGMGASCIEIMSVVQRIEKSGCILPKLRCFGYWDGGKGT